MADLVKLFPDASPTAIQMVMQFGMVGSFPVTLCIGFFSQRFRIKPMILIGLCTLLIGGMMPLAFHSNLIQLYISAVLIGAGQGFMSPLVSTLTLRNFEDKSRARQVGLNSTFGTGGATIFTLLAGVLALSKWSNIYYLYFIVIPALICAIVFMPLGDRPDFSDIPKEKKAKVPVPPRVFVQAGIMVIIYIGYVTFPINVGMLVAAAGFGDAASTGLSMSIITVVGALFGIVFPYVVKTFKTYIGAFACFCGAAGLAITAMASNMLMVYVAAVMCGCFFGSNVSGAIYIIGRMCKREQFGPSLSIILGCLTLGVVLSPIVINIITPMWGGIGSVGAFTTSSVILGVVFFVQLLWGTYVSKKYPEEKKETQAAAVA